MITKQQALEFIYEFSQMCEVCIDIKKGFIGTDPFVYDDNRDDKYLELGYDYSSNTNEHTLEAITTQFIKDFINTSLFKRINKLPVDVDMLEVGQTYKVHVQEDWNHRYFTEKFMGFDEEDSYILNFENSKCSKYDIREMYKVTE